MISFLFSCVPEIQNITLRFPPTAVPNTETNYMCMTFDLPDDDLYQLVATEPFIDNAQVMHHMILHGCDGGKLTVPIFRGGDVLIPHWAVSDNKH